MHLEDVVWFAKARCQLKKGKLMMPITPSQKELPRSSAHTRAPSRAHTRAPSRAHTRAWSLGQFPRDNDNKAGNEGES